MLRRPISKLTEFSDWETFQKVIPDQNEELKSNNDIRKVVFVSGQLFHDLEVERNRKDSNNQWHDDIAIIRIEQLAPVPYLELSQQIDKYPNAQFAWAQEEKLNFGPWGYLEPRLNLLLKSRNKRIIYAGRGPAAVSATGYASIHQKEI